MCPHIQSVPWKDSDLYDPFFLRYEEYDEATGTMNRVPLHSVGSSKLCRKTHIDIANKAQVNMYATELHEVGSSAVEHYSMLEIRDLFMLFCAAFNQPRYRVDKQLNVLTDAVSGVS